MTSQKIRMTDGAMLFTRLLGSRTDRAPIIALHGAPGIGSHSDAEAAWTFLTDRHQVLVFDARGNGVSDALPPLSHEQWVADIETLRGFFGWQRIVLAAHSYGGFIALDYALQHLEHVAALMLVSTSASCARNQEWMSALVTSADRVIDRNRLDRLLYGTIRDDDDLWSAVEEYASLWRRADASASGNSQRPANLQFKTHNAAFSRACSRHDVRAELSRLACPTLICVGAQDRRLHFGQLMARQMPFTELALFEHSGHAPALEEPVLFQASVRAFLDRELGRPL